MSERRKGKCGQHRKVLISHITGDCVKRRFQRKVQPLRLIHRAEDALKTSDNVIEDVFINICDKLSSFILRAGSFPSARYSWRVNGRTGSST